MRPEGIEKGICFKIPRRNESEGYGEIKCFEIPVWRGIGNESVDTDVAELLSKGSERKWSLF